MISYSAKILTGQPLRLAITVAGISLCIVLMLFLLAAYHGVADGSVDYIRKNRSDLWVLSSNAWNILRGSSILLTADATHFHLSSHLDAYEGETRVFTKSWRRAIPRDRV